MRKRAEKKLKQSDDVNSLFMPTYKRNGSPLICGKGMYLYDEDENVYLDFGAGIAVNALGHGHPAIVNAIRSQSELLIHASNLYLSRAQIDLADALLENSFADHVFFSNSGTEANEAAIKFARKWASSKDKEKFHILSFYNGFHGRTYGALSATAQEQLHEGFEPLVEGFHWSEFNNIKSAKKMLSQHKFAAILVEPIQGEGGIIPATEEFLNFLRNWCTKNKAALIFDEIQTGMGRTGTLWNYQQYDIVPDILTLAKPLGGGIPLGATLCTSAIAKAITPGNHGTTFGGNPVACAAGLATLNVINKKSFLKNIVRMGSYITKKLEQLQKTVTGIKEVRGCGLLIGIEFDSDPTAIVAACKKAGLLLVKAGHNTVRMLPPLIVTKDDIDSAVSILQSVLESEGR
ncbi:MAG: aspartate aminotransferase family protein [Chitinispirillaceae bacterium]|nr:aspartate aminotransferase family protein [Chitinispirillaceae bacterium]